VPHFLVIPRIVADTDLVVTVPARVAETFADHTAVRVHALPPTIPSFDVSLSWHPRFANDPPIEWLRALMLTLFQDDSTRKAAA
jgi:DNA-binding transcriptional LysR family regulator